MEFGLPVLLAMGIGYLLKRNPNVSNKIIPIILFVSQLLGRLLVELGVATADAGIFSAVKGLLPCMGDIVKDSLIATLAAVGTHSSLKNTWPFLLSVLRKKTAEKVAGS